MRCKIRCGDCCKEPMVSKDTWLDGDLTWAEKQYLIAERQKKPAVENACLMLWFDNKIAHCLIEDLYGKHKKDKNCQEYICKKAAENN